MAPNKSSKVTKLANTLLMLLSCGTVVGSDPRLALIETLFVDYLSDLIPTCPNSSVVTVKMDMSLRGILDVDAPSQVISTYVWQRWAWNDCRLTWNPEKYGGVKRMLVSTHRLWIPDITVYDSVGSTSVEEAVRIYRSILHSDGRVFLMFPIIIHSACKLDVTFFPYDRQVCRMKFASWSYTGTEIDLLNKSSRGDTSVYVDNGEWNLIDMPCQRLLKKYTCCEDPFPEVIYYLILQREHLYYLFNLVLPCILITLIALLVFYLPPESGEKMSLGITVLLSLTVFLLMVADRMPATSETIPLIGQYVGATIIIVSTSCCMTVLTLNIHHKGKDGSPVPAWVYTVFVQWLGWLLCVPRKGANSNSGPRTKSNAEHDFAHVCRATFSDSSNRASLKHLSDQGMLLRQQLHILESVHHAVTKQHKEAQLATDWRLVAMALDRLFLVLHAGATVAITAVILCSRPQLHNDADISTILEAAQKAIN